MTRHRRRPGAEIGVSEEEAKTLKSQEKLGPKLVEQYRVHKEQLNQLRICHR
jgi:hypothetical protein